MFHLEKEGGLMAEKRKKCPSCGRIFNGEHFVLALISMLLLWTGLVVFCAAGHTAEEPFSGSWRLKIKEAVAVQTPTVFLGDLAEVIGDMDEAAKMELLSRELWAAPVESGRPMAINRDRLTPALQQSLGEMAERCLVPGQVVIQRGGKVFSQADLQQLVAAKLAPAMAAMKGEAMLREYKLPPYIFVSDAMGQVIVELPGRVIPGRLSVRLIETAPDGAVLRQFSGNVFLDLWVDVPTVSRPLQKGEMLTPEVLTLERKNAAYIKGEVWDGGGGPWRVRQATGASQPLLLSNIEPMPRVSKGNKLTLVFEKPGLRVETAAIALADGGVGDSILVRNTQSNVQVMARVVDHGTVRVP